MTPDLPIKRCTRCLLLKPLTDFYRDPSRSAGYHSRCKLCHGLPGVHQTLEQRFWSKVQKTETCWLWIASKGSNGYGHFYIHEYRHSIGAHIVSWFIHHEHIWPLPGWMVLHDCPGGDNKACVNPAHLWLGTHTDNYYDALDKGQITSEILRRRKSKLNETQCQELRKLYATGQWTVTQLGRRYGVRYQSILYRLRVNNS